jgi:hypothetical protein
MGPGQGSAVAKHGDGEAGVRACCAGSVAVLQGRVYTWQCWAYVLLLQLKHRVRLAARDKYHGGHYWLRS